jgi:thiol-disulfide isomerase/thioredoxin
MSKFAPFAVLFLSLTCVAQAADVRDVKDPAAITKMFAPSAKLRLVNVWATWCAPCVEEIPVLRSVRTTFGSELSMVGVSLDDMIPGERGDTRSRVAKFLDAKKVPYPNAYYVGSGDALADAMKIDGAIPVTIIYDHKGKELWRRQGSLDQAQIMDKIHQLLKVR